MAFIKKILVLTLFSLLLVACKTAPVLNVDNNTFNTSPETNLDNVTKSIIRAGSDLGWQMKQIKPGLIVATLHLRSHMAQVNISYTTKSYSINYKDSSNLNYKDSDPNHDGQAVIHSNYNGWIKNLSNAINRHVYSLD